jgi:hypothetical protein
MAYDRIETAAYRMRLPADLPGLLGGFHAFNFPGSWPEVIRQVWEHDAKSYDPEKKLPVYGVNRAIRALVPDVLYAGSELEREDGLNTWLYAREPMDAGLLKRVVQSWLQTRLDAKSDYPRLREAVRALDLDAHTTDWRPAEIDPDGVGVNEAGTATIDPVLYRLIPEMVAERIVHHGKFDGELSFVQAASDDGAELISWPPQSYPQKSRNGEARLWHYSAVITIFLRVVPFDPAPRLHMAVSTRRWATGQKLFVPPNLSPSVYVRPIADPATGFAGTRFAVPSLTWNKGAGAYVWRNDGPAGVLESLTVGGKFPDAERIKNDPGAYLPPTSNLEAAVVFHNRMGSHAVLTGVLPDERRRILSWAAEVLPDAFERALQLEKVATGKVERQLVDRVKVRTEPKEPKPEHDADDVDAAREFAERHAEYKQDHAAWETERAVVVARREAMNARTHRKMLVLGTEGNELRVDVVTDTDAVRAALVKAAGEWLGLEPESGTTPSDQVLFRDEDLRVRLVCHPAGRLTSALGDGTTPKRGEAHLRAIDERAEGVSTFLQSQELASELVLVEIQGPDAYQKLERRKDPYNAIRQGAARAGRVTQFIATEGENLAFRAAAAWADGIRSLGIGLDTPYAAQLGLPEQIDQVAFWQVRRNVTTTVSRPVFMPIAVLIRPGQPRVMARTPQTKDWIPYNQLLCDLACADRRPKDLASAQGQREEMGRFMRVVLPSLRGRPLLLLAEAANLRSRWSWLSDAGLRADTISLGEAGTTRLAAHNKQLRVVRVRTDSGRLETPAWWTVPGKDGLSGFTSGLFQSADAESDGRVFYSLADKSRNLNKLPKSLRKFTRNGTKESSPNKAAPVPRIIELDVAGLAPSDGDGVAAAWAAFVHQQRFTEDRSDGRELPHVLDLCSKAGEYAFPESLAEESDDDAPEQETADNAGFAQGSLDLDL